MPCMQVHHIRSSVPRYFLDLMYNTQSSYTYTPLLLATHYRFDLVHLSFQRTIHFSY